jgi:hypothetical protein
VVGDPAQHIGEPSLRGKRRWLAGEMTLHHPFVRSASVLTS